MARANRFNVKKGDVVYVMRGKDREHRMEDREDELGRLQPQRVKAEAEKNPGKRGKVLGVNPRKRQVLVEGANMITKHAKPRGQMTRAAQMQTGRIQQPGPLDISNVMLVCPRCDRPTKVTWREVSEKRIRVCRRCNEYIDEV
jgi:large subunit ribosomal protein L24